MKTFLYLFFAIFLFFPSASFAQQSEVQSVQKKQAVYFYANWCPHCKNVDNFFKEKGFYEKYDIIKLNFDKKSSKETLGRIFEDKGYKEAGIPTIVIDEEVISGDEPIIKNFERKIESSKGTAVEYVNSLAGDGGKIKERKRDSQNLISMPVLIGAALVDAINPCAFAVLILLVATVLNAQGKKKALQSGLLFSLAVFVSYILMGLGVYKAITIFNLPKIFSLIIGGVSILIGLANLKDFFWYGKVFIMEVPFSWRPKMQGIIKHVTSPLGALTAGFTVSLFLLPCTSGPYVVILGLLAEKTEMAKTIPLLILYNLIFVLPMVIITLAVSYFGVKAGKLEAWRQENLKLLHLIAGVIMVGIGAYLISGWI